MINRHHNALSSTAASVVILENSDVVESAVLQPTFCSSFGN